MNLMQLKYAVEVERTGSITRAAKNLFMGQPNLSRAIKELEQEIGIILFKRTVRGAEPTRQGEEFLEQAKGILAQMGQLEQKYRPDRGQFFKLSLSVPRTSYYSAVLQKLIDEHLGQAQQLDLRFRETSCSAVIEDVSSGEADIGIVRFPQNQQKAVVSALEEHHLCYEVLGVFQFCLVMAQNSPLAQYDSVPLSALENQIEIAEADAEPYYPLEENRRRIVVYDRGSRMDLLSQIEGTYLWTAPMPKEVLERYQLIQRPCCQREIPGKELVVYQKPIPAASLAFLEFLKKNRMLVSGLQEESSGH